MKRKNPPCTTRQHFIPETIERNTQDTRLWTAQSPCSVVQQLFVIVTLEIEMVSLNLQQ